MTIYSNLLKEHKNIIKIIFLCIFLYSHASAALANPNQLGKWCGSRGQSVLSRLSSQFAVDYYPEEGYLGRQANFSEACKSHDECYWHIERTKEDCDKKLELDLLNSCKSAFGDGVYIKFQYKCSLQADLYYSIVNIFGNSSYNEAQAEAKVVLKKLHSFDILDSTNTRIKISKLCSQYTDIDGVCLVDFVSNKIFSEY